MDNQWEFDKFHEDSYGKYFNVDGISVITQKNNPMTSD